MELDTGSFVSTLKYDDAVRAGALIFPSDHKIMGYGGNPIKIIGKCSQNFSFQGKEFLHTFLIVESDRENLFGRDLCLKLDLTMNLPDFELKNVFNVRHNFLKDFN